MSDIKLLEKIRNFKEEHCYQYQRKLIHMKKINKY